MSWRHSAISTRVSTSDKDSAAWNTLNYCSHSQVCTPALDILEDMGVRFSAIEAKSALRAGEMQRRSWQRGDIAGRPSRDFLVGAHALLQCNGLITRDDAFFRTYFKGLKLIVPSA